MSLLVLALGRAHLALRQTALCFQRQNKDVFILEYWVPAEEPSFPRQMIPCHLNPRQPRFTRSHWPAASPRVEAGCWAALSAHRLHPLTEFTVLPALQISTPSLVPEKHSLHSYFSSLLSVFWTVLSL